MVIGWQEDGKHRTSSQYAKHMAEGEVDDSAVSQFALTKTMKEQREFLPVFSVRQKLLSIINDNQVVVRAHACGVDCRWWSARRDRARRRS